MFEKKTLFHVDVFTDDRKKPIPKDKRRFQIPSNQAGAIIGVKGATIQRTREMSGCSVKIEKLRDDPRYNVISLYGTREQVDMAYNDILLNLQMAGATQPQRPRSSSSYGRRNRTSDRRRSDDGRRRYESPERRHDSSAERSFVIMVPKIQIAGLIGRRGDSVNYIRRESRCRIVIKEEGGVSQDSSKREVVLHGTDHEIQVAKRLIQRRLSEIDEKTGADIAPRYERGPPPPPPRYNQYPRPYVFVQVVEVVVSKSHAHKKKYRYYDRYRQYDDHRRPLPPPIPSRRYDDRQYIRQESSYRSSQRHTPPYRAPQQYSPRPPRPRQQQQQPQQQLAGVVKRETMSVSSDAAGRIIGTKGSSIREIRKLSQAIVTIGGLNTATNGMREVVIQGTDSQIQSAKYLISVKAHDIRK